MKKYLFLASAATLLLGSCSDDLGLKTPGSDLLEGKSKVYANFVINDNPETRTTVNGYYEDGKAIYPYDWNKTDGIGVSSVVSSNSIVNTPFSYATQQNSNGSQSVVFTGDTEFGANVAFYAYYPYNPVNPLTDDGTLTLSIPGQQSYNATAANGKVWNANYAIGSFSQYAAPAVSAATSENANEVYFTFKPVASYISIPVKGYSTKPITQIKLQITNPASTTDDDKYQQLYGNIEVTMADVPTAIENDTPVAAKLVPDNTNNVITLNCGSGIVLSDTPVDLWFVVPAGTVLSGATVELTFNTDDAPSVTREIASAAEGADPTTTITNNVTRIWKDGVQGQAFTYMTPGTMAISETWQFLEYANLVTVGVPGVVEAYEEMVKVNPAQAAKSYLPYMLSTPLSSTSKVNTALIVAPLPFDPEEIEEYIGSSMGLVSTTLDPYYNFLQKYVDDKAIPQIGGNAAFTMSGVNLTPLAATPTYPTISGLEVTGNGMFYNSGNANKNNVNIENLVLSNVTVNVEGEESPYYFLFEQAYNTGNTINSVTVNSDCSLVNGETEVEGGTLFDKVSTQAFSNNKIQNVTNNASPALGFANALVVNDTKGFDFTQYAGAGVNDFGKVLVINTGAGEILYVGSEADATTLLGTVGENATPGKVWNNGATSSSITGFSYSGNLFSVVSWAAPVTDEGTEDSPEATAETSTKVPGTSYWTGTTGYSSNNNVTTAEQLAFQVQKQLGNWELEFNNNIDLRNLPWTTNNEAQWNNTVPNIDGKSFSISNVNINGLNLDGTPSNNTYMTLFGPASQLKNLTINNVNITNSNPKAYVAALSWVPGGETTAVTVNGLTIKSEVGLAIGGLYASLGREQFEYLEKLTLGGTISLSSGQNKTGYIASLLDFATADNENEVNLSNPVEFAEDASVTASPFGSEIFTITPVSGGTTVTVEGFNAGFVNADNIQAGSNTETGALLKVIDITAKTTTYYSYNGTKYVVDNVVNGTVTED